DKWLLESYEFRNNSFAVQPYVANGYIGIRLPTHGQGYSVDQNTTSPSSGQSPTNGWPLFDPRFTGAFLSGFWNYQLNITATNFPELLEQGGESVISTLPVWSTLLVTDKVTNSTYSTQTKNDSISNYYQSLSFRNGVVHTNLTWSPSGNNVTTNITSPSGYELDYTVLAHRSRPNLGIVRLDITSHTSRSVIISDILDGAGSWRTQFVNSSFADDYSISTAVRPEGVNTTAFEYSSLWFSDPSLLVNSSRTFSNYASKNDSTTSQQIEIMLPANSTYTIIKYVGIASTDAFPSNAQQTAMGAALRAKRFGWDSILIEHNEAWDDIWNSADIIIPDNEQLQTSIRASIYHLLANMRPSSEGTGIGDNSVSISGLSSDSYAGFIFWDADLWMFHGIQALFPQYALSINNYRAKLRDAAIKNAEYYNLNGAIYPWTSSRFGNCTSTGPCVDYQYHLNVDIALANWNYYLSTNDTDWLETQGWPIIRDAADMFTSYVQFNQTITVNEPNGTRNFTSVYNGTRWNSTFYYTLNLTDSDDNDHQVNNDAFTNAGISQLMGWAIAAAEVVGETPSSQWASIKDHMYLPQDEELDLTLEYEGMNGSVPINNADVILLTYPLQFNQTDTRARNNFDYYASKQSSDGLAWTYAVYAINAAKLATSGCSTYTYLLEASQPYLRAPYYQFSETAVDDPSINGGTNPAFPFLTGHGSYLQVYTHGFTGFRVRPDALYLDPMMVPQMPQGYTIKGLKYQGSVFDINVGIENTTVLRRPDESFSSTPDNTEEDNNPVVVRIASRNEMAGDYSIQINQTISVPTFRSDFTFDIDGNIAQCLPVSSNNTWAPGKFPVAINDGDNSTYWQPLDSGLSSLVIDLGDAKNISSAYFLWGAAPP
ncbi:Six-hairpin glycosidase, partial [Nadsonia fulvescens var. elongata DSM 6958]